MPSTEIYVAERIPLGDDQNWYALGSNVNDNDGRVSALIASFQTHELYHATDLSYIRVDEAKPIDVGKPYLNMVSASAIAFKNPGVDRWWFGAVTKVEYVSEGVTRIHWKEDIFNNWWASTTYGQQYVVREHTNDDTIGANTEPENVELGPYITTATTSLTASGNALEPSETPLDIIVMASQPPHDDYTAPTPPLFIDVKYHKPGLVGGLPQPFYWFRISLNGHKFLTDLIDDYSTHGRAESIIAIVCLPRKLFATDTVTNAEGDEVSFVKVQDFTLATRTMPGGYVPTNKKLYTYPYCTVALSTNSSASILHYENFSGAAKAKVAGGFGADASCTAVPANYEGQTYAWQYALTASGLPILAWTTDAFKNWMGQNWGKTFAGLTNILLGATVGAAAGSIGTVMSSVSGTISTIGKLYDRAAMPNNAHGAANAQNILALTDMSGDQSWPNYTYWGFFSYCRTCKKEYMQLIDDHFTRLGYATNRIKWPNFYGRKAFNFVQIANPTFRGAIPDYVRQYFQSCFAKGVTLWHTGAIGDYSQDNGIKT